MTPREMVLEAFRSACTRVDVPGRVARALAAHGPFVVIAAGKAATAMFSGVRAFERALVVIPRGSPAPASMPNVEVIEASHPLPDESSVRAAEAALALAACDSPHERLFLISGGASSLLCAPCEGLTLERKREVVDALLHADAAIDEINVVRRHLSRIKGGGLARACGDEKRRTLIVSDVLSDAPHAVGSGPSVEDPTTLDDAREIAARRALGELPFVETWKTPEQHTVLAGPSTFAKLVATELERCARVVKAAVIDVTDITLLADHYAKLAKHLLPGQAHVFAAEPVLRVTRAGRGGRCTHLAALMSSRLPEGVTFAAIATDGVDGTSGTSGAIVDRKLEGAERALADFDTGPLHVAARSAIANAPTGLNFTDVHVLMRL